MKKRTKMLIGVPLITFPLIALLLIAISCCSTSFFDGDDDDDNETTANVSSEEETFLPKETSSTSSSQTISLREYFGEDVSSKTLYFVTTNPTSSTISSSKTPYIESASGISLNESANSSDYDSSTEIQRSYEANAKATHAVLPMIKASSVSLEALSSRAIGSSITANEEVSQLEAVVGETTKDIYIDSDSSISTYRAANATLRAIGKYCYIWVVDGFYEGDSTGSHSYTGDYASYSYTTTSDEQLSQEQVNSFASTFDEIYPLVREVFGEESDKVNYYSNGWTTAPMNYLSDTGTMVNIVLYDIGADHTNADASGVLGYFYSRDYYPNAEHIASLGYTYSQSCSALKYSNEGKYFYIDAYSASSDSVSAYSTIAHEFQHMISYGVKTMEQNISTTTAHEEMMSMLCEDILQEYLGVSDDESPEARLPFFEGCYRYAGLEYRSDNTTYAVLSYATNYAFGSWLVRNFGGVELIKEMAQNKYEGISCIVSAVNSVNSASYTISNLLKMYAKGCMICSAEYTHNKAVTDSTYPLKAIDLWNLADDLSVNSDYVEQGYYSYTGCTLYGYNAKYDVRPYGMLLVKVGSVTSADATVTIANTSTSADYVLYVE